jgi:RNA polymerase sigma-70 factor, ECF subfamily
MSVVRVVGTLLPSPRGHESHSDGPSPRGALDEPDFDTLFRECVADVHSYAISLLGERAAAEDVTATAFERLYRSRSRLDRRRGTPRAWLFAIARNAALDELRRRGRQPRCDLPSDASLPADASLDHASGEAIEHVERREQVREALEHLPLRDREVVLLKFHGQLSNGELARVLGISESNAGTRLHRALTRLREDCFQIGHQEVA